MTNNELDKLSENERKIAELILKQYNDNGHSDIFDNIKFNDFDEVPVTIHEFLHNKKYLGNALYDPSGKFTLFPY